MCPSYSALIRKNPENLCLVYRVHSMITPFSFSIWVICGTGQGHAPGNSPSDGGMPLLCSVKKRRMEDPYGKIYH